jgi:hypothetical protein
MKSRHGTLFNFISQADFYGNYSFSDKEFHTPNLPGFGNYFSEHL